MSKELKALKELKKRYGKNFSLNDDERCCVIETALKRLEVLEKPKEIVGTTTVDKALEQFLIGSCPEVKKKLKALEIIKTKLLAGAFENGDYSGYAMAVITSGSEEMKKNMLTEQEYNLLKEILK